MTPLGRRPGLSEKDFLRQVTELAAIRGWLYLHLRPARTQDSWRTPISGPLGKGWVDLVMVRESDGRVIFCELKAEGNRLTPEQREIARLLYTLDWHRHHTVRPPVSIEYHNWRPADWDQIEATLR